MKKKEEGPLDALAVEQLSVYYDRNPVLWDVSFSIPKGQLVALVGPNGAGKSTLIKAALGIIKPMSGSVTFAGKRLEDYRKKIAYVPQRESVDWSFPITAFELVLMGRYGKLGVFKWPRRADKQAALQALARVGMEAFADRQIGELSGGQQQRLFFARALLQEGDILFLDEPFAGVDAASEKILIDLLNQQKKLGKTIVVVHHELSTVKAVFDWVVLLSTCLIASGKTADVMTDENIRKAYGSSSDLLEKVARKTQEKLGGDPE